MNNINQYIMIKTLINNDNSLKDSNSKDDYNGNNIHQQPHYHEFYLSFPSSLPLQLVILLQLS